MCDMRTLETRGEVLYGNLKSTALIMVYEVK